jgi:FkbM family methyltransferase
MRHLANRITEFVKQTRRTLIPAHVRFQRAGRSFLEGGEPEVHELPRLVEPGSVAVDVGALLGDYAYSLCRLVGPTGLVVCVEPQRSFARLLRKAAARLRLPMTVVECALSSRAGEAEIIVPEVDGRRMFGFASIVPGHDTAEADGKRAWVALRRLDDVIAGLALGPGKRVSFLKVDVEGHELEVFQGATETLARYRPNLLVEIEQRHSPVPIAETFAFLEAQGYTGSYLEGGTRRVPLSNFDIARNQALGPSTRRPGRPAPGYISNFFFEPA